MTSDFALIRGDALSIPLADNTVDLVATSPPYFALRSYQDGGEHYEGQMGSEPTPADFLAALWAVTDELWRVLKPTGSLFVNLGDKYAGSGGHNNSALSAASSTLKGRKQSRSGTDDAMPWEPLRSTRRTAPDRYNQASDVRAKSLMGLPWRYALGLSCPDGYRPGGGPQWVLRAEIIWDKPNGLPESVTDRVRRSHEQWFHFTKEGRYFAAVDEVREAHADKAGPPSRMGNQAAMSERTDGVARAQSWAPGGVREYNALGKLPGSVWTIPSEPLAVPAHLGVDHFAAFPQEWPRRLILGWSPSGICTKCREGRRPVVDRQFHGEYNAAEAEAQQQRAAMSGGVDRVTLGRTDEIERTITGYACACDVPLAPTRPAVVLDPFAGTGTVPMVARALGRYGIGIDLSADYLRLAQWRIRDSRHGAKSINRTNRERQGALW